MCLIIQKPPQQQRKKKQQPLLGLVFIAQIKHRVSEVGL